MTQLTPPVNRSELSCRWQQHVSREGCHHNIGLWNIGVPFFHAHSETMYVHISVILCLDFTRSSRGVCTDLAETMPQNWRQIVSFELRRALSPRPFKYHPQCLLCFFLLKLVDSFRVHRHFSTDMSFHVYIRSTWSSPKRSLFIEID